MGCNLCVPTNDTIITEYYGPITDTDVVNAVNNAVEEYLAIFVRSPVDIVPVKPNKLTVPVVIKSLRFNDDSSKIICDFASNCSGTVSLRPAAEDDIAINSYEDYLFDAGDDNIQEFNKPETDKFSIYFDFVTDQGVSCRVYTYSSLKSNRITMIDDKICKNGSTFSLMRVYKPGTEEVDGTDADDSCVICRSEPSSVITLPCRHLSMCLSCAKDLTNNSRSCPVCRTHVSKLLYYSS